MNAITVASRLAWGEWIRGIFGALISGGASAIATGTGVSVFDPSHDIVGITLVKVMAGSFLFSGLISLAKFLQTHPVPDPAKP